MMLKYPQDHAIISIRLVMTELLEGNNVMMAHELVHSLAKHLHNNNNDDDDDDKHPQGPISQRKDGTRNGNLAFMSLYPTWYRNGTLSPVPAPIPPGHSPQVTTTTTTTPVGKGNQTTQEAIITRHLLTACFFFEAAGLRAARDACVVFGIRHGWHEVLEWAVGSASVDAMDGLWYGKVAVWNAR